MAEFPSEGFFTEGVARYVVTLVFKSAVCWNETAGEHQVQPKRMVIKMEVSNLRLSTLTDGQIKALAACLPSLHCGPLTDELFDQTWHQETFYVWQLSSTSHLDERRSRTPQQPHNSEFLLVTPLHSEDIDIQTLANTQNHFNTVESEGRMCVRVTTSVHSPDGRECLNKWRVSDYDLDGRMILSVICTMITPSIKGRQQQEQEEQEEQDDHLSKETEEAEHEYFSY
ncbi:uncharacterized protein LOC126408615 [Epinephelus moara]|uniref:uncharacterized protein LOC126408615 n=1 Tax=Epinephelus moara TaxID=300413 RepID=UPI00214EE90D|nr:uncharacterized protein LOC126408615 [Epinephelus moara]